MQKRTKSPSSSVGLLGIFLTFCGDLVSFLLCLDRAEGKLYWVVFHTFTINCYSSTRKEEEP